MESWTLSISLFDLLTDFAALSACLLIATVARRYWSLLQRFLVPNALLAGFIGLVVGPEVLHLAKFPIERMGAYVYHLLALAFICVGLQGGGARHTYGAVNLGFMQVMIMLTQGLIGLLLMFVILSVSSEPLVPAAGMLLPLGFAMGPGIAYSIGQSWAPFGFAEGASVGLTLAAIGFIVAYVGGVIIVNRAIRSGQVARGNEAGIPRSERLGIRPAGEAPVGSRLTLYPGAIEPLAFHAAVVLIVYAATYWTAALISEGLFAIGLAAEVPIVWSFHFILGNLLALLARTVIQRIGIAYVLDSDTLHRLAGWAIDLLITASIMAISIGMAWKYAGPILAMSVVGTLVTYHALKKASDLVFDEYRFERFIGMFGEMTGTMASGLALVRITDPEYRSPVPQDLVLSSGMALAIGFPLFVVINLPFTVFGGATTGYVVVGAIMATYLVIILGAWRLFVRRSRRGPESV